MKIFSQVIVPLVFGILGAMIFEIFLLPYLIKSPQAGGWSFLNSLKREVVVNPVKNIYINDSKVLQATIEMVQKSVVRVASQKGPANQHGCGFIATSDGLVVTLGGLVPPTAKVSLALEDGREVKFGVLKRDIKDNLALLKISGETLKTTGFAQSDDLKIGDKVFLLGINSSGNKVVNAGILKSLGKNYFQTNILERGELQGSPVFNLKGNFVGLGVISKDNEVEVIPVSKIQTFITS